eukprot:1161667-Pelagomonas_calceolata.AAC.2
MSRAANKKLEQACCSPTNCKKCVEPSGAGMTNTTYQAKLAATAAITHCYAHVASDSLTTFHQIC